MKIKLYIDQGVDRTLTPFLVKQLDDVSSIQSKQLIRSDWEEETDLLIMPGGRDVPFDIKLRGEGNRRIRQFIEQGGAYLGICAGAYYGCKKVEFDVGQPLEVQGVRELVFFPGVASGPAFGPGTFRYGTEWGTKAALISYQNDSLRTYFNGGCTFVDAEAHTHVDILSRYLEIEGEPPAIIKLGIGKGNVILSGVHFEIGCDYPSLDGDLKSALISNELKRKVLFTHIFNLLNKNLNL